MDRVNDYSAMQNPALPDELPDGCTRRSDVHWNFGGAGGAMQYGIYLPDGRRLPIAAAYDTRKRPELINGYRIEGDDDDHVYTGWSQVRERWKELRAHKTVGVVQDSVGDESEGEKG